MEPLDYRNATFADLKATLQGKRLAALSAWRQFGPGTTREVSKKSDMDLLTFRPRTTELFQLGLLGVVMSEDGSEPQRIGHEGIYKALTDLEAFDLFRSRQAEARKEAQLALQL
jgi:hypothetical protein